MALLLDAKQRASDFWDVFFTELILIQKVINAHFSLLASIKHSDLSFYFIATV